MRRGELIAGYEGLSRFGVGKNYHIADKDGRAYLCGCAKSIWLTTSVRGSYRMKTPSSMRLLKNSKKINLEQWHRQYTFQCNLERMEDKRAAQMFNSCEGTWSAVGTVQSLDRVCNLMKR